MTNFNFGQGYMCQFLEHSDVHVRVCGHNYTCMCTCMSGMIMWKVLVYCKFHLLSCTGILITLLCLFHSGMLVKTLLFLEGQKWLMPKKSLLCLVIINEQLKKMYHFLRLFECKIGVKWASVNSLGWLVGRSLLGL